MSRPLETRIAAALTAPPPAADLASLIEEVSAAAASATVQHQALQRSALDPASDAQAAENIRQEAERLGFNLQRLHTAADRLGALHRAAIEAEDAEERARVDAALQAKREAARAQWDREYPLLANRIAGLVQLVKDAGLRAPHIVLGERYEGVNPSLRGYMPPPSRPEFKPDDYAPSCAGDLIIRTNGASK
jgi:hypothetical protein